MPFLVLFFVASGFLQGLFLSGYTFFGVQKSEPSYLLARGRTAPLSTSMPPVKTVPAKENNASSSGSMAFPAPLDVFATTTLPLPSLVPPLLETSPVPDGDSVISFAGDVMFDRYIRTMGERDGYAHIIKNTAFLFEKSDLIVLNLEGPITRYATKSVGTKNGDTGHYTFTFAPESLRAFFGVPSRWLFMLGNNHILNFGNEGLLETKAHLRDGGFSFFGAPDDEYTPYVADIEGMHFAFLGWNEFTGQGASLLREAIVRASKENDAVIVFAHWGAEYETLPREAESVLAHSFVDAGAKLVVGAHAHVVAHKEIYRGAPIYYSLGNFVFDQYFSPEVRCGAVVHASFSRERDAFLMDEDFMLLEKDGTTRPSDCMNAVPALE